MGTTEKRLIIPFKGCDGSQRCTKIIDQSKEQEEKLRSFFADVPDKKNVAVDKFKEVLGKVTEEFKKNADVVAKQLAESGPKVLQSVRQAATSAIKDLIPKF